MQIYKIDNTRRNFWKSSIYTTVYDAERRTFRSFVYSTEIGEKGIRKKRIPRRSIRTTKYPILFPGTLTFSCWPLPILPLSNVSNNPFPVAKHTEIQPQTSRFDESYPKKFERKSRP